MTTETPQFDNYDRNFDRYDADHFNDGEPISGTRTFEDLTLAEMIGQLIRRPTTTISRLRQVVQHGRDATLSALPIAEEVKVRRERAERKIRARIADTNEIPADPQMVMIPAFDVPTVTDHTALMRASVITGIAFVGFFASFMLASMESRRADSLPLGGVLLIMCAIAVTIFAGIAWKFPRLERLTLPESPRLRTLDDFFARYGLRIVVLGFAIFTTSGAWVLNSDNNFTQTGFLTWLLSIAAWFFVLYDGSGKIREWVGNAFRAVIGVARRPVLVRASGYMVAVTLILLVAAFFRFTQLSNAPPDMTSDHVEKLLDAVRVTDGQRSVFFANNGGREPFQMYYLSLLHTLGGIPFSFELLKIGSGIEGMLMVVVAFWVGRVIFGEEDKRLGMIAGVVMAGFIATSYWHTMLSRLGLRIVLTTIVAAVMLAFLARGMRHNRRIDFLLAGLTLGVGLYMYQAVRMLPLVVIAAGIITLLYRARNVRAFATYGVNFACLVIIAGAVFVPMARYWQDEPDSFWRRTEGRLFGDNVISFTDPVTGEVRERSATLEDRINAFTANIPALGSNIARSLWMFNWIGDRAFITGSPQATPELDPLTGTMFMLGVGLCLVRVVRRRDPVDLLMLVGLVIMILPTALSIAFVIEVPSATRASGSLPFVYLIAALPLALIVHTVARNSANVTTRYLTYALAVGIIAVGALVNHNSYFGIAMKDYRGSTLPHRQAGTILDGFTESTGTPGNAFMIGYPHWMDHRAIGIESGDPKWNNGVVTDNGLINYLTTLIGSQKDTIYQFDPNRQMLFFLNQMDAQSLQILQENFPNGHIIRITTHDITRDFILYVAPPIGCDWVVANLGSGYTDLCRSTQGTS